MEDQNEFNEQLQAEISQVLIETECQDCKQKQLKMTMLRQNSQKRLGVAGRVDTDGAGTDYWDMNSSQASGQLENIGRFADGLNDFEYRNDSMNLDSQVMMINDPTNKDQLLRQNSGSISQILDSSPDR